MTYKSKPGPHAEVKLDAVFQTEKATPNSEVDLTLSTGWYASELCLSKFAWIAVQPKYSLYPFK